MARKESGPRFDSILTHRSSRSFSYFCLSFDFICYWINRFSFRPLENSSSTSIGIEMCKCCSCYPYEDEEEDTIPFSNSNNSSGDGDFRGIQHHPYLAPNPTPSAASTHNNNYSTARSTTSTAPEQLAGGGGLLQTV
jgi:hypothetical protein